MKFKVCVFTCRALGRDPSCLSTLLSPCNSSAAGAPQVRCSALSCPGERSADLVSCVLTMVPSTSISISVIMPTKILFPREAFSFLFLRRDLVVRLGELQQSVVLICFLGMTKRGGVCTL